MRYLGLDLGTTSLGVSITDKTNTLVRPLTVIKFKEEDYESLIGKVQKIIADYGITKVVLGLPLNMDGSRGFASTRSLNFQKLLAKNNIPVSLVDERLTTKEAENIIHSNNENIKKTKDKIDGIAAAVILESYLKRDLNDFTK